MVAEGGGGVGVVQMINRDEELCHGGGWVGGSIGGRLPAMKMMSRERKVVFLKG